MEPRQIVLALMRARAKVESRLEDLYDLRTQPGTLLDFAASEAALRSAINQIDSRLDRLCRPQPAPMRPEEDDHDPFHG